MNIVALKTITRKEAHGSGKTINRQILVHSYKQKMLSTEHFLFARIKLFVIYCIGTRASRKPEYWVACSLRGEWFILLEEVQNSGVVLMEPPLKTVLGSKSSFVLNLTGSITSFFG